MSRSSLFARWHRIHPVLASTYQVKPHRNGHQIQIIGLPHARQLPRGTQSPGKKWRLECTIQRRLIQTNLARQPSDPVTWVNVSGPIPVRQAGGSQKIAQYVVIFDDKDSDILP
jgi:hypothetical protein